jgi:hypothetical protein
VDLEELLRLRGGRALEGSEALLDLGYLYGLDVLTYQPA